MFAGYLFLRFKDGHKIHQINPSQTLMNLEYADTYVMSHCLSLTMFNATKIVCAVCGKRKVYNTKWYLKGEPMKQENEVKHFGVVLSNNNSFHISLQIFL